MFAAIAKEIYRRMFGFCWEGRMPANRTSVLLSWTGTMFEYLMPVLWMRAYPNTLLDNSRIAAVRLRQIYAAEKGVPWGFRNPPTPRGQAGITSTRRSGFPSFLRNGEPEALVISPFHFPGSSC